MEDGVVAFEEEGASSVFVLQRQDMLIQWNKVEVPVEDIDLPNYAFSFQNILTRGKDARYENDVVGALLLCL